MNLDNILTAQENVGEHYLYGTNKGRISGDRGLVNQIICVAQ
jgi:hypothetical protein